MDHEMIFWAPQRKPFGGWRCFKSSPKAPQAPDPVATANAQTASNISTANAQAALNRNNQYTPWGSQTWQQVGTNPDGTAQWSSTITLDPAQQKLLDSSNNISQMLANLGIQQAGQVGQALAPIDYSKLPQMQGIPAVPTNNGYVQQGLPYAGQVQSGISGQGQVQSGIEGGGALQSNIAGAGNIGRTIANAGQIQTGLNGDAGMLTRGVTPGAIQSQVDMSGVSPLVGGDALRGQMQDAQRAAYNQQAQYLDSQYSQRQHDLENQLVQQGVTQNSDAWNRAMQNLGQQRTFDYNNAFNNSFSTGLAANNQLFNQGLSTNQNAYYQALNNGQFANGAQAQQFGQGVTNAQLNNSAIGQQFGQSLAAQQANNAAQAQKYSQNANDASFGNSAQAQQFGQNQAQQQATNATAAQQFAQNQAQGQFANTAQQQLFNQLMAQQQQSNMAQQQRFDQGLAAGQFGNAAQAQQYGQSANGFNQGLAASQLSMQQRSQALQELLQQQQQPINILNALRSGSQVSAPQFGQTPQGVIQGTDIGGLYNNQYQGQLSAYNGQIAQNNATTAGLGQAAMAAALYFSDRRLKTNIQRIGTHPIGVGIYEYEYLWGEPAIGVMADEVEEVMPHAVVVHPSGFKMVNYGVL